MEYIADAEQTLHRICDDVWYLLSPSTAEDAHERGIIRESPPGSAEGHSLISSKPTFNSTILLYPT
jgi:hypothetical protein